MPNSTPPEPGHVHGPIVAIKPYVAMANTATTMER